MESFVKSAGGVGLEDICCRWMCLLYALSLAVTYAEKLTLRKDYSDQGWLSWRILSFDRAREGRLFRQQAVCAALFGVRGMTTGLWAGIAGAVALCSFPPRSVGFTLGALLAVGSCLLVHARTTYAGDGSQQVNLLLGAAALLGFNPWVNPMTGAVCLLFVAAQSLFSYFVSGVAKVVSPVWQSGSALQQIMATTAFGSEFGAYLAGLQPGVTRWVCRATVAMEVLFPVVLFGPRWMMLALLAWGVSFHLANAFLMGLNTFLWSYLATYPAVFFTWSWLHTRPGP